MPLRIVMLINEFRPIVGGGERQAERLARALVARGHEVTVLTRKSKPWLADIEDLGGIQVIRCRGSGKISYGREMLRTLSHVIEGVDVLHAHQTGMPLAVALMGRGRRDVPVVATPMAAMPELRWTCDRGVVNACRRRIARGVDVWIAKSREIRATLEAAGGWVIEINNGIDVSEFRPRPSGEDAERAVVFLGRLAAPKRVDLLLEAWRRCNTTGWTLRIFGDGPKRQKWQKLCVKLGCVGVEFPGQCDRVANELRFAEVLVLPSDHEGMPNALIEGMASGLTCVASRVGAVPELLGGGAGVIVDRNTVEELARALEAVLADATARAEFGTVARKRVIQDYSIENTAARVESVYLRAIDHRRGVN